MSTEKKTPTSKLPKKKKEEEAVEGLPDLVRDNPEILEKLQKLDPEEFRTLSSVILTRSNSYSGPLPPAEQFRIYEETAPGAGNRILTWAEKEQSFRHDVETKMSDALITETYRGQNMGLAVMAGLIVAALLCGLMGQTVLGVAFVAAAALDVVRKFIDGRDPKNSE